MGNAERREPEIKLENEAGKASFYNYEARSEYASCLCFYQHHSVKSY